VHIFDHNIGFWEKRQFFAKNWQKSQKIVIITSTSDWAIFWQLGDCLTLGSFIENCRSSPNHSATFFYVKSSVIILEINWVTFWAIFCTSSPGHPVSEWTRNPHGTEFLRVLGTVSWNGQFSSKIIGTF
jgi:hypothetical protein